MTDVEREAWIIINGILEKMVIEIGAEYIITKPKDDSFILDDSGDDDAPPWC